MRKTLTALAALCALGACDKHDPILPGTRTAIFDDGVVSVMGSDVPNLPDTADTIDAPECNYRQDASNAIWDGDRKIFSGFPTANSVKNNAKPVCGGGYVYAGLTTGELIKVNPKNRAVAWVADIYRDSNLTGGASVVDIVAPITQRGGYVYAGGLGDAFCKVTMQNGAKKWCTNISTATPYLFAGDVIFVVATDGNLYALRDGDGAVYWRTPVKKTAAPTYADGTVRVGREKINATTGEKIK